MDSWTRATLVDLFLRLGLREVDTIEEHTTGGWFDMPALPNEKRANAEELADRALEILNGT